MEKSKSDFPLQGQGIVITRPKDQAQGLAEKIRQAGGEPLLCPALDIEFFIDDPHLAALSKHLDHYQKAIFISANAVRGAMPSLRAAWPVLPSLTVCAPGQSTAQQLQAAGWPTVVYPAGSSGSSELLALPLFKTVQGERILIFSGEGGNTSLENTLTLRGAHVDKIAVYRRRCATEPGNFLLEHWTAGKIHVVLSASSESLLCFHQQLSPLGRQYLKQTPLLVISDTMAETAKKLGYDHCLIRAADARDDTVLKTLIAWRGR